eukprot:TRINITY_DN29361_c0_g1_i1.p1 TRINITY_DN29361_c0_g1~~TRINITY_DN29361_c0_g1_i1.p1  ORF type:complete len:300 (-),score=73.09 TRINITY_DN29361_c0_g1_i1:115-960(-)
MADSYQPLAGQSQSRSDLARDAYASKDASRSIAAHSVTAHTEPTNPEGKYLKPVIFGGLDGISTIFAFLAGAVGAKLTLESIVALGCAQLFAGAFGMGFGEYLSSEAERQVAQREQDREHWEVQTYPQGEINEMIDIYKEKGLTHEDATLVANTLSKYEDFWVEHMMLTEIGMMPPEGGPGQAMLQGVIMFMSFLFMGALPLVAYVLGMILIHDETPANAMVITCGASVGSLFLLGVMKAYLADMSLFMGGGGMAVQGCISAICAYAIGTSIPAWLELGSM